MRSPIPVEATTRRTLQRGGGRGYSCSNDAGTAGGAGGDPQVAPRQLTGRRGGRRDAELVNGFGPLGSHSIEMPTEMVGGEMAQYVTYCDGGGGAGNGGFYESS